VNILDWIMLCCPNCEEDSSISEYIKDVNIKGYINAKCPKCGTKLIMDITLSPLQKKENKKENSINEIQLNKDGKDCRNCKHKDEKMVYCQAAMCPSTDDGNGYHAFEPI